MAYSDLRRQLLAVCDSINASFETTSLRDSKRMLDGVTQQLNDIHTFFDYYIEQPGAQQDYDFLLHRAKMLRICIKREKLIIFKIKNTFVKAIMTATSANMFEHMVWEEPECRYRRIDIELVIAKILNVYVKLQIKMEKKERKKRVHYTNVSRYDVLTDEPTYESAPEDLNEVVFEEEAIRPRYKQKTRAADYSNLRDFGAYPTYLDPPLRNPELLKYLRKLIIELREDHGQTPFGVLKWRLKMFIHRKALKHLDTLALEDIRPQMDTGDAHGVGNVNENKAGNVVLTETAIDKPVKCIQEPLQWTKLTTSDIIGNYSEMTDRWLYLGNTKWTTTSGSLLKQYNLPRDVVVSSEWNACDLPNTIPFMVHRYWRGDMEVKIQVNSNKFQIGQLQASWYYDNYLDAKFSLRTDKYINSQAPHVLINAGSSNEVTLYIPYMHHFPMLSTKKREDILANLSLGTLLIRVLNPLTVPQGGPTEANFSVFVRFVNSEFTGQIAGDIAKPQMDTMIKMASGALNAMTANNMDNPPIIVPPAYVVPTASHSWASGTGTAEPVQTLRLDPRGQTIHDTRVDEMNVNYVASKYGLVKTIQWSKNLPANRIFESMDASPLLELKHYNVYPGQSHQLSSYAIPPVGVISSLYNYWRGSIKFRFDVVASQFHTGRLIVGYVPGAVESDQITVNHLRAGPHMTFTLQTDQQFEYEVPFISDRPFWPRKYSGNYITDQHMSPSRIYVGILNPLIPMENVADSVYINIYMAAGSDFEVAVPIQPCLGTAFNRQVLYQDSEIVYAKAGYSPYYVGKWHTTGDVGIFRYGPGSDHVAQFDDKFQNKSSKDTVGYYYKVESIVDRPTYYTKKGEKKYIDYIVMATIDGYTYGFPVGSDKVAKKFVVDYYQGGFDKAKKLLMTDFMEGNSEYTAGNPPFIPREVDLTPPQVSDEESTQFEYVEIQGERDAGTSSISTGVTLQRTVHGKHLYGENFGNLKDLMRRYQFYTKFTVDSSNMKQEGQCAYIIPILPQGLGLDIGSSSSINEIANRLRDGIIPLLASGYRFYRGGIRIRIVMPALQGVTVWCQHRPDRRLTRSGISQCKTVSTGEAMLNHGYATYVQDVGVNSIIELEVPFYQNTAFGLLQTPQILKTSESMCYSLGNINIGFSYSKVERDVKPFNVSVYYSLADDMQFTQFQGFPPMLCLDDIGDVASFQSGLWTRVKDHFTGEIKEAIKEEIHSIVDDYKQIDDSLLSDFSIANLTNSGVIRNLITNLMHVAANFNVKSIAIALTSILVEIGIVTTQLIGQVTMFLQKILIVFDNKFDQSGTKPSPTAQTSDCEYAEEVKPNGETTTRDEAITGFITLLWLGVCSIFAVKGKQLTSFDDMKRLLLIDLSNVTRSASFVFMLLRNIMSVLDSMKVYLFGLVSPAFKMTVDLSGLAPELKAWSHRVIELENPRLFQENQYKRSYQLEVEYCYVKGMYYHHKAMEDTKNEVSQAIFKIYTKIFKLHEKLSKMGTDTYIRREPFVMWQCGQSGVGKSTISTDISVRLIKDLDIPCDVAPIYVHSTASDHWDACNQNPIMMVDDVFAIQSGESYERQLQMLFAVVSPVVLVPPKASLEDKGRAYNPEILMLNSNYDFMRFNAVHMDAIHRRRDILFRSQITRTKKPGCVHCQNNLLPKDADPRELADYHHLEFCIARDVLNPDTSYDGPYNYAEFYEIVKTKFRAVREKNIWMFEKSANQTFSVMTERLHATPEMTLQQLVDMYELERKNKVDQLVESSVASYVKCLVSDNIVNLETVKESFINYFGYNNDVVETQNELPSHIFYNYEECKELLSELENKNSGYTGFSHYRFPRGGMPKVTTRQKVEACVDHYGDMPGELGVVLDNSMENFEESGMPMPLFLMNSGMFKLLYDDLATKGKWNKLVNIKPDPKSKNRKVIQKEIVQQFVQCRHLSRCLNGYIIRDGKLLHSWDAKNERCYTLRCDGTFCVADITYLLHEWMVSVMYNSVTIKWAIERYNNVVDYEKLPQGLRKASNILQDPEAVVGCLAKVKDIFMKCYSNTYVQRFMYYMEIIGSIILFLAPLLGFIALGAVGGMAMYGNFKMAMDVCRGTPDAGAFQSTPYSAFKTPGTTPAKLFSPNVQSETQQSSVAVDLIKKNIFKITGISGDKILRCYGLLLKGRQVLLLSHYLEEYNCYQDIKYYGMFPYRDQSNSSIQHGIQFDLANCEVFKYNITTDKGIAKSNFVVVNLPRVFQESKDITKFIATEKDHKSVQSEGLIVHNNGRLLTEVMIRVEDAKPTVIQSDGVSSVVSLTKVYSYAYEGRGMCGSILVCPNLQRPIIGMHVAGVSSGNVRGFSEPLFNSMFDNVLTKDNVVLPDITPLNPPMEIDGSIFPFARISKEYTNYQSGKTQIVPSLISGVLPINTEPAPLSNNDERLPDGTSPLFSGIANLGKPPLDFENHLLDEATEHLQNVILTNVKPVRVKVDTYELEHVICGDVNTEGCRALEFTTSPGFPLKFMKDNPGNSGKKWLFDLEDTNQGYKLKKINPKLNHILKTEDAMRKKNIRPMTVFVDSLKDSCIAKDKCGIPGKTRIFSISPIQYTIAFRQYFEEFLISYRKARFSAEHGIGITCDGPEWSELARLLVSKGDSIACGDYKNFGPGLMLKAARKAFDIILAWYKFHGNDQYNQYRNILAEEILSSIHLVNSTLYSTPAGIPSGSPITTELNSLVNSLYIRCAYLEITKLPMCEFQNFVQLVTYGDDVCMGLADNIKNVFNTLTLSLFFERYGIKYTDLDKTDNIVPYRTLLTCSFLKRKFVPHPTMNGEFLAKIDYDSIGSCLNWVNKKLNKREAILQNCEAAQILAYGHGKIVFDDITQKIIMALQKVNLKFKVKTWNDYNRLFFSTLTITSA